MRVRILWAALATCQLGSFSYESENPNVFIVGMRPGRNSSNEEFSYHSPSVFGPSTGLQSILSTPPQLQPYRISDSEAVSSQIAGLVSQMNAGPIPTLNTRTYPLGLAASRRRSNDAAMGDPSRISNTAADSGDENSVDTFLDRLNNLKPIGHTHHDAHPQPQSTRPGIAHSQSSNHSNTDANSRARDHSISHTELKLFSSETPTVPTNTLPLGSSEMLPTLTHDEAADANAETGDAADSRVTLKTETATEPPSSTIDFFGGLLDTPEPVAEFETNELITNLTGSGLLPFAPDTTIQVADASSNASSFVIDQLASTEAMYTKDTDTSSSTLTLTIATTTSAVDHSMLLPESHADSQPAVTVPSLHPGPGADNVSTDVVEIVPSAPPSTGAIEGIPASPNQEPVTSQSALIIGDPPVVSENEESTNNNEIAASSEHLGGKPLTLAPPATLSWESYAVSSGSNTDPSTQKSTSSIDDNNMAIELSPSIEPVPATIMILDAPSTQTSGFFTPNSTAQYPASQLDLVGGPVIPLTTTSGILPMEPLNSVSPAVTTESQPKEDTRPVLPAPIPTESATVSVQPVLPAESQTTGPESKISTDSSAPPPRPSQTPSATISPGVNQSPAAPMSPEPSPTPTVPISPEPSQIPTVPISPEPSQIPTVPISPEPSQIPTVPISPEPSQAAPEIPSPGASQALTVPMSPESSQIPTVPMSPESSQIPTVPISPEPSQIPTVPISPEPSQAAPEIPSPGAGQIPTVPISPEPSQIPTVPISPEPSQIPTVPISPEPSQIPTVPISPEPSQTPTVPISPEPSQIPTVPISPEPSQAPPEILSPGATQALAVPISLEGTRIPLEPTLHPLQPVPKPIASASTDILPTPNDTTVAAPEPNENPQPSITTPQRLPLANVITPSVLPGQPLQASSTADESRTPTDATPPALLVVNTMQSTTSPNPSRIPSEALQGLESQHSGATSQIQIPADSTTTTALPTIILPVATPPDESQASNEITNTHAQTSADPSMPSVVHVQTQSASASPVLPLIQIHESQSTSETEETTIAEAEMPEEKGVSIQEKNNVNLITGVSDDNAIQLQVTIKMPTTTTTTAQPTTKPAEPAVRLEAIDRNNMYISNTTILSAVQPPPQQRQREGFVMLPISLPIADYPITN